MKKRSRDGVFFYGDKRTCRSSSEVERKLMSLVRVQPPAQDKKVRVNRC